MKKATAIVSAVLILAMLACLGACGKKREPATAAVFQQTLEDAGFVVQDVTASTEGGDMTDSILVAIDQASGLQIEFYAFKNSADASASFENNKNTFEAEGSGTVSSVQLGSFSKYKKTAGDTVMMIAQIESTMLYCKTDKANDAKVTDIFDQLGYK